MDEDDAAALRLNRAPKFDAETAERMVDENTAAGMAVSDPVMATDPDGDVDTLTYSLDAMGDMYFDIDDMGQITVGEGTMLDFESGMDELHRHRHGYGHRPPLRHDHGDHHGHGRERSADVRR